MPPFVTLYSFVGTDGRLMQANQEGDLMDTLKGLVMLSG